MELSSIIIIAIVLTMFVSAIAYIIREAVIEYQLFKPGHNPHHKICRRCGQHFNEYTYTFNRNHTYWEAVYPLGDDPECECLKQHPGSEF